jgi:hypothetical protein
MQHPRLTKEIFLMKKEMKKTGSLNTRMDLAPLNPNQLRSLRKKADDMGLKDFVGRIDQHTARLRSMNGSVSDRENCYLQVFGRLPPPSAKLARAERHEALNILYLEIPEGELAPIKPGTAVWSGASPKWIWEKSGARAKLERAHMRAEKDAGALEDAKNLHWRMIEAHQAGAVVVAVMYKKHASDPRKGTKYRLTALKGRVVSVNSDGGYRVEFEGSAQ